MTSKSRRPVPDLVKRFVPTPYKLIAQGSTLETNDLDLLNHFEAGTNIGSLTLDFQVRVIRETCGDAELGEIRQCRDGDLSLLMVGNGTVTMVDRRQRRVYAFLSPNVTNHQFAYIYLPMAMEQTVDQPKGSIA